MYMRFKSIAEDKAWEMIFDTVDYPVEIVEGYYRRDDQFIRADGISSQGYPKSFAYVVVDRHKNGNWTPIAPVTSKYGTLPVAALYRDFVNQVAELDISISPHSLFVSVSGGAHILQVRVKGFMSLVGKKDNIVMVVALDSSYDTSSYHQLRIKPFSETHDTYVAIPQAAIKLKARHTHTIGTRIIGFVPTMTLLMQEWNTSIIPYMAVMHDCKFSRDDAIELIRLIAKEAKMSDKHVQGIHSLYIREGILSQDEDYNLYRLNISINRYISAEMAKTPDLQEKVQTQLGYAIQNALKKATGFRNN